VADVERGRLVPGWRPRRLGGGLGATRAGGKLQNVLSSGRAAAPLGGPPPALP
jgi:U1 small nuclear ribonucleoprotein